MARALREGNRVALERNAPGLLFSAAADGGSHQDKGQARARMEAEWASPFVLQLSSSDDGGRSQSQLGGREQRGNDFPALPQGSARGRRQDLLLHCADASGERHPHQEGSMKRAGLNGARLKDNPQRCDGPSIYFQIVPPKKVASLFRFQKNAVA